MGWLSSSAKICARCEVQLKRKGAVVGALGVGRLKAVRLREHGSVELVQERAPGGPSGAHVPIQDLKQPNENQTRAKRGQKRCKGRRQAFDPAADPKKLHLSEPRSAYGLPGIRARSVMCKLSDCEPQTKGPRSAARCF
eukprot:g74251.t1